VYVVCDCTVRGVQDFPQLEIEFVKTAPQHRSGPISVPVNASTVNATANSARNHAIIADKALGGETDRYLAVLEPWDYLSIQRAGVHTYCIPALLPLPAERFTCTYMALLPSPSLRPTPQSGPTVQLMREHHSSLARHFYGLITSPSIRRCPVDRELALHALSCHRLTYHLRD
jgi:hypothetical protein